MKPCHASYERFRKIKGQYSYIFGIRQFCARIELATDQHFDLNLYYRNGRISNKYNRKLPEDQRRVLEDVLEYCQALRAKLMFNADLEWLCVITGNLAIKSSYDKEAVKIFTDDGDDPLFSCDPAIHEILWDIQEIMLDYAQDGPITLLCRWLDATVSQLGFGGDGRTVHWLGVDQGAATSTRTQSDFHKLQQAMNFITSVRYENRCVLLFKDDPPTEAETIMSPDIDWLCDMANYVIALLPAIDDKLSWFLTDDCENLADGHFVWCKRVNLKTIDSDEIQRSMFAQESFSLN